MRPWTFPAKRGTRTCCHSLHTLGIRCLYLPTYQRKLPATKSCNTTAREGNAALWKNMSNFTTNPHYKALGEKREKRSASEEIVLRKLFSLNRKHFVMEKFYLWPMKQSVFCIINYWGLVRYMLNGWLEMTSVFLTLSPHQSSSAWILSGFQLLLVWFFDGTPRPQQTKGSLKILLHMSIARTDKDGRQRRETKSKEAANRWGCLTEILE